MLLGGCATDAYHLAQIKQLEVYREVEAARAQAYAHKYDALAQYARTGDSHAQIAAVLALNAERPVQLPPPVLSSPSDDVFKWASLIVPSAANLVSVGFGYKLGVTQSNNSTLQALGSYGAIASVAGAGFNAVSTIGGQIQAPVGASTVTTYNLNGTGVLGSGTYTRNCSSSNVLGDPSNPVTLLNGNC